MSVGGNKGIRTKEEDESSSDEPLDVWAGVFTEDPILLSQFLALKTPVNEDIIKNFQDKAAELAAKPKKSKREQGWLNDYCLNHAKLLSAENLSTNNGLGPRSDYATPRKPILSQREIPPIKVNELVKKPESFDGHKPPARKWLDDFEKAADVNGWSDQQMVKYFSTFLEKAANDWYVTVGRRKLGPDPNWMDLRSAFIRHYLGDSDKLVLRRQIERTLQGERVKGRKPQILFRGSCVWWSYVSRISQKMILWTSCDRSSVLFIKINSPCATRTPLSN